MEKFKHSEIPESFISFSHEDQLLAIELGTSVLESTKSLLMNRLKGEMTEEERKKAKEWEKSGEALMKIRVESLQRQMKTMEEEMDKLIQDRVRNQVASETVDLRIKLAEAKGHERQLELSHEALQLLKKENQELKEKIIELTPSKSSHVIGKQGETMILKMLESVVEKEFPYSSVTDMTSVKHAADFHVWITLETLQKVKILVDSKNYTRSINSDEVNKLYSDVDNDEEAHGGLMISIGSQICKAKPFHIGRTLKQKPVLFISFQNIDDINRKEMVCWALRTISVISGEKNNDERLHMVDRIEEFLQNMELHMKGIDSTIRLQMKVIDGLRETYNNLLKEIIGFRDKKEKKTEEIIEHVMDETNLTGCDAIQKNGIRCGKNASDGGRFCKIHRK